MSLVRSITFSVCAALSLSACDTFSGLFGGGGDGLDPLRIENVGPSTKELIKPLSKDLSGDTENKLYGFDELRPEEPSDGEPL